MTGLATEKLKMEYIDIDKIKPNPLNPRKNNEEETHLLQELLKEKGWETGITCYPKEDHFVILSGHRRWYAATRIKEKKIPVFIVEPPKTELEELERLGSAQGAQVDWNPFVWAKYTFELWNVQGRPSYGKLAKRLRTSEKTVSNRIKLFLEFDKKLFEEPLENGELSLYVFNDIADWVSGLKKNKPNLVRDLSEEYIKERMIAKALLKHFNPNQIRADKSILIASDEELEEFITSRNLSLREFYDQINKDGDKKLSGSMLDLSLDIIKRKTDDVKQIGMANSDEYDELEKHLKKLLITIDMKETELETFINKKR